MKIAFDISSAAKAEPTGIARYEVELVRALSPLLSIDDRLLLIVKLQRWTRRKYLRALFELPRVEPPRFRVPRVDIFHAGGIASLRRTSGLRVVTVHDTATIDAPRFSSESFAETYSRNLRAAVAKADLVLTVSGFVRQRVLALCADAVPERVIAIHHAADHASLSPTQQPSDKSVLARHGLAARRFVLFVGRVERRKNPDGLIEAFARCSEAKDHLLVFAGAPGMSEIRDATARTGLGDHVRMLGRVDDSDLAALYRQADAFALPSHHEGFGIPLLEALACGTPSLASNSTAMPEVAGDAAVLVNPRDIDSIARGLASVLSDGALREKLKARGPQQAAKYTWNRCARETLDAYRRVLELGPRP